MSFSRRLPIAFLSQIVVVSLGATSWASLYPVSPSSPNQYPWSNGNSNPTANDLLALTGVDVDFLYKKEFDGSGQRGPYANSYSTSFVLQKNKDPSGALVINTDSSFYIDDVSFPVKLLTVKDGNHAPNVYVIDISDWNGQDDLSLSGFWLTKGSISNIAIWGGGEQEVIPEAASLIVWSLSVGSAVVISSRRTRVAARRRISESCE